jgi:hypothetical protein
LSPFARWHVERTAHSPFNPLQLSTFTIQTSPFFYQLRSAYQAELDDLRTDSEGHDVLRKRLAEKRQEINFLVKMMELSPEMVAVVLHQAFRFTSPATMDHLLGQDADDLPAWDAVRDTVEIATWARDIVQSVLREPAGEWFMTIAAALEYMHHKPLTADERRRMESEDADGDEDGARDRDDVRVERHDDNHTEDHDEEEADARAREDAGNDWMVEQGFDRKE